MLSGQCNRWLWKFERNRRQWYLGKVRSVQWCLGSGYQRHPRSWHWITEPETPCSGCTIRSNRLWSKWFVWIDHYMCHFNSSEGCFCFTKQRAWNSNESHDSSVAIHCRLWTTNKTAWHFLSGHMAVLRLAIPHQNEHVTLACRFQGVSFAVTSIYAFCIFAEDGCYAFSFACSCQKVSPSKNPNLPCIAQLEDSWKHLQRCSAKKTNKC